MPSSLISELIERFSPNPNSKRRRTAFDELFDVFGDHDLRLLRHIGRVDASPQRGFHPHFNDSLQVGAVKRKQVFQCSRTSGGHPVEHRGRVMGIGRECHGAKSPYIDHAVERTIGTDSPQLFSEMVKSPAHSDELRRTPLSGPERGYCKRMISVPVYRSYANPTAGCAKQADEIEGRSIDVGKNSEKVGRFCRAWSAFARLLIAKVCPRRSQMLKRCAMLTCAETPNLLVG